MLKELSIDGNRAAFIGHCIIPRTPFDNIIFLTKTLLVSSIPYLIALLIRVMLTQTALIRAVWPDVDPLRNWAAYHKLLQKDKWSSGVYGVHPARLIVAFFSQPVWSLIFDITFKYCSSKNVTECLVLYQRVTDLNRTQQACGQYSESALLS